MEANAELFSRAQSLLSAKRAAEAERVLRQLLAQTHVIDFEYDEWLKSIANCYRQLNRPKEVGYVLSYLQNFAQARQAFDSAGAAVDAARTLELESKVRNHVEGFRVAAERYLQAGRPVLSAVAQAQATDPQNERGAWERVLGDSRLRGRNYELALVHFNLGLAAHKAGDRTQGTRHLISSQRLLEEVADEFETRGERERAFDCYAILLKLGKDSSSYENLAEGYINCIRVLKEDNLKFYVLQYYEDFLRISLERQEFHAAATVCREAADYARRVGLIYDRGYMQRAAETWIKAALKNEENKGPPEITENAYLAAIESYNSIGDFFSVRACYQALAQLGIGEKKQKRYEQVVTRYSEVSREQIDLPPFPDYLRQQHAYPEIWFLDLIEWELDGSPQEVCATIVGDTRYADMIRRRALGVLLTFCDASVRGTPELEPSLLAAIARGMGELQAYAALRPLEKMYDHVSNDVRLQVMEACRHLYFKRTFQMISRGLHDESKPVRKAALKAMAALHFPHAFDPLTRIFRESEDAEVKEVALTSIGRIASLESGEFLVEVLRYETPRLRDVAGQLLSEFDNPDMLPLLEKHLEIEGGGARPVLEQAVRSLRGRGLS